MTFRSAEYTTVVRLTDNITGITLKDLREFVVGTAEIHPLRRPEFVVSNDGHAISIKLQEVTYAK